MGLEQVELVMDAEKAFAISIGSVDNYGQSVSTVGEFNDLILRPIRADPSSDLGRRPDLESYLRRRVVELSAQHGYGPKPEQIKRETRFIEDLGYG